MSARRRVALAAPLAAALLLLAPHPAGAAGGPGPAELCGEADVVTFDYTHPSLGWTKPVTRATATRGGCASGWATGHLTAAAITKQCSQVLSQFFPFAPYGYLVENQGDCIRVMTGLSSGELDPGPVDPFPYR